MAFITLQVLHFIEMSFLDLYLHFVLTWSSEEAGYRDNLTIFLWQCANRITNVQRKHLRFVMNALSNEIRELGQCMIFCWSQSLTCRIVQNNIKQIGIGKRSWKCKREQPCLSGEERLELRAQEETFCWKYKAECVEIRATKIKY